VKAHKLVSREATQEVAHESLIIYMIGNHDEGMKRIKKKKQ
jgi:hypothetical protein